MVVVVLNDASLSLIRIKQEDRGTRSGNRGGRPDAKVEKVRDGGRVVRKCLVIAHGVHESGRREVIGLDGGECETEAFWRDLLRSLVKRGLTGVQQDA